MKINTDAILAKAEQIPSWTFPEERRFLSEVAQEVLRNGLIVEVGALYGGTTAVLCLSAPTSKVTVVDEFSWTPEGYPQATPERLINNLAELNISNVELMVGDSRVIGKNWSTEIDLLWIDGGHSYDFVYSDLRCFGPWAQVIALHDYGNSAWESVKLAVEKFLSENSQYHLAEVVGTVAILRKDSDGQ